VVVVELDLMLKKQVEASAVDMLEMAEDTEEQAELEYMAALAARADTRAQEVQVSTEEL
jgi:rubrerythrin